MLVADFFLAYVS